jgi:hypothetical protein
MRHSLQGHQQQPQHVGFETGTGFAVTPHGAIGFAQDVEAKMAQMNLHTGVQALAAAPCASGDAQSKNESSSDPRSNREAFERMHITCESIVDDQYLGAPVYEDEDEESGLDDEERFATHAGFGDDIDSPGMLMMTSRGIAAQNAAVELHRMQGLPTKEQLTRTRDNDDIHDACRQWLKVNKNPKKMNFNAFTAYAKMKDKMKAEKDAKVDESVKNALVQVQAAWRDFKKKCPDGVKKSAYSSIRSTEINFWKIIDSHCNQHQDEKIKNRCREALTSLTDVCRRYEEFYGFMEKLDSHGYMSHEYVPGHIALLKNSEVTKKCKDYANAIARKQREKQPNSEKKKKALHNTREKPGGHHAGVSSHEGTRTLRHMDTPSPMPQDAPFQTKYNPIPVMETGKGFVDEDEESDVSHDGHEFCRCENPIPVPHDQICRCDEPIPVHAQGLLGDSDDSVLATGGDFGNRKLQRNVRNFVAQYRSSQGKSRRNTNGQLYANMRAWPTQYNNGQWHANMRARPPQHNNGQPHANMRARPTQGVHNGASHPSKKSKRKQKNKELGKGTSVNAHSTSKPAKIMHMPTTVASTPQTMQFHTPMWMAGVPVMAPVTGMYYGAQG